MLRGTMLKQYVPQEGGVGAKQVILVRAVQPPNALSPMLVTELGMVMEVREEQS